MEYKKETEPTKEDILQGIREGLEEVELHKQGKIKLKSAKDLINELKFSPTPNPLFLLRFRRIQRRGASRPN